MGIIHKQLKINAVLIGVVLLAVMSFFGQRFYTRHAQDVLAGDLELAKTSAENGNLKIVRDLILKYPDNTIIRNCKETCFEKIKDQYIPLDIRLTDDELDQKLNTRIGIDGILVRDLIKHTDQYLWCCVQVRASDGEFRYIQLYLNNKEYTLDTLQQMGVVQGSRVRAYGFLDCVDRKMFSKDDYGIRPVEKIFVLSEE